MTYLVILVVVATVGMLRLWLQHRREQSNRFADVEGLRARLERVTSRPALGPTGAAAAPESLEPRRRAAAKRRIEARRRARAAG